ncbi:MAG: TonB-dependent receptor, partial [Cyclobacteriaceae bacterium]
MQLDSPIPVDNVSSESLSETGFGVLDQQLMFLLPAYNSTQQPISDAGAHFNTSDLKGLFSSRTLILLNGKRKNASALVYSYVTPGRGEVGVDMKSIPTAAIDHVEVLRDGAAAQYGSDAVAGVINLVLKKKSDPFINYNYSATTEGDGQQSQVETGFGVDIAKRGYANFTFNYFNQKRTQRAGDITSAEDEAAYWGTNIFSLDDYRSFLSRNPKGGTQVGLPDMTITNVVLNTGYTLSEITDTKIYAFGSHMQRHGSAPQFTRVPYWVYSFQAIYPGKDFFLPEIAPEIKDQTLTLGLKTTFDDWDFDFSTTLGRSRIDYFINNSFNQSYGAASPSNFYNGAHQFSHFLNNVDIIKTFRPIGIRSITVAFGAENRNEEFETEEGEYLSYADGTPNDPTDRIGAESFPGFTPENASHNFRNNIGAYAEVTTEFTPRILVGAAARFENYSDFGSNVSWKANSRLVLVKDKLNLRGSVSSGFRAPALHQIY